MTNATDELLRLLDGFEHECFMLRVEASETHAKDEAVRDAYERIREESARAIAATLGSGECELVYGENDHGDDGWWCQSCDGWFAASFRHTKRDNIIKPRYCQQCGRKAVER